MSKDNKDNNIIKDISSLIGDLMGGSQSKSEKNIPGFSKPEKVAGRNKKIIKWNNVPASDILKRNETHQDSIILPNVFSSEECDKIVDSVKGKFKKATTTNPVTRTKHDSPSVRKTDLKWIDLGKSKNNWIYERMAAYIESTNDSIWGYDLAEPYLIQGFQLGRYSKGDFYDWHVDGNVGALSIRRLSITVQLTDPSEYEGGNFEIFRGSTTAPYPEEMNHKGSVIMFPSHIWHKVNPITTGVRYSLVGWVLGNTIV